MQHEQFEPQNVANAVEMAASSFKMLQTAWSNLGLVL
jgi:hypothetical protein